jgi:hypothetical protein
MDGKTSHVHWPACAVVVVCLTAGSLAQGKYAGGSGRAEDPYLIRTAEQMNAVGLNQEDWDKHFELEADIDLKDLAGSGFHPIGSGAQPFTGVFAGKGHSVSNLTYPVQADEPQDGFRSYVGLFGLVDDPQAQITQVGLIDPQLGPVPTCPESVWYAGALVGCLRSGSVTDCHVDGGQVSGDRWVGGLIGSNGGTISNCWTACSVAPGPERSLIPLPGDMHEDHEGFGGLVGENSGDIRRCHSTATVSGAEDVGGLVGSHRRGTITDSWARGSVSARWAGGGLVGYNGLAGTIMRCHAAARVWAEQVAGGLVAKNNAAYIRASWAGGDVAGEMFVGGLVGLNTDERYQADVLTGGVADCYATARVRGSTTCGGLIGGNVLTVSRCYALGEVSTTDPNREEFEEFGLVGANRLGIGFGGIREGVIEDCFWDTQTSGQSSSQGGGTGLPTAEMQSMWTYIVGGWDFAGETVNGTEDIWQMCCGRPIYPKLAWEPMLVGDFVAPEGIDFADLAFLAEHWLQSAGLACVDADLTFDARADMDDFMLLAQCWRRGARKSIFETMLDVSPGWTTEGLWQFGVPTGRGGTEAGNPDPTSGYTGENVYGLNLHGDYTVAVDGPHYLIAGPFDCRAYRDIRLQFARWLNSDEADYVQATVEISTDGTTWSVIWRHRDVEAIFADDNWQVVTYALGPMADHCQSLYLRWGYEVKTSEAWPMSGWNIDDVVLTGIEQQEQH